MTTQARQQREPDAAPAARPAPAAARPAHNIPEVEGQTRLSVDSRQVADDLRGLLETRRAQAQEEAAAIRARGNIIMEGHRLQALDASIRTLDADITSLRTGAQRQDLQAVETIARRNQIPPEVLSRDVQVHGDTHTVANTAAASGIGRTHTETRESTSPGAGNRTGAESAARVTETRTTNLDETGLNRSRNTTGTVSGPDGATQSHSEGSSVRLGAAGGGLGIQTTASESDSRRRAGTDGQAGAGITRSSETTNHVGLTANGGSAGSSQVDSRTLHHSDGSSSERRTTNSNSYGVTTNDAGQVTGVNQTRSQSQRRSETDAEGNETRRETSTRTGSVGIVDGENGRGVTGSVGGTRSEQTRDGSHSYGGTANGTLTDRQVGAGGTAQGSYGRGPARVSGNIGASGSYTVTTEPVRDSSPPQFDLVTVLQYEVSLGGSVGTNSDRLGGSSAVSASVSASARRQHSTTFRHRMTAAEVAQYQAALRRAATQGGRGGGSEPAEIGLVDRLRLASSAGRVPSESELTGSAEFARNMQMNSSVEHATETQRSGGVTGQGTVGVVSAGGSYQRSHTDNVTRREERLRVDGRDTIRITLTFAQTDERTRSGNASVEGIGGRLQQVNNDQSGRTIVVDLDPQSSTFAADHARAMAVNSQAQAEALAQRTGAQLTRREQHTETTSGGVGTMDDGAVSTGVTASERRQRGREVTVGRRGADGSRTVSGTTTGQSQSQAGVNVLGTQVASASSQTSATNTVDENGRQDVAVTNTQTGGPQLPAWLESRWRQTYQRMQSYDISEGDMSALVGRAGDSHAWMNCLNGRELLHIQGPWNGLRAALLNPRADAEWLAANREMALKIARGEAITNFIASVGPDHGIAAMRAILRNANPSSPLGVHWEWPDALRSQQRTWTSLHAEVRGARERFGGIEGADRAARIQREVTRIVNGLRALLNAISSCGTFEEESAKVEMLDAIDRDIRDVERAQRESSAPSSTTATPARSANPPAAASGQPGAAPSGAAPPVSAPEQQQQDQRQQQEEQKQAAQTTARRFKRTEASHWQRAQGHMGTARGRIFTSCHDDVRHAFDELRAIETDWVGLWGGAWRNYVRLSNELGQNGQIDYALRTNTNWRINLLQEALSLDGNLRGFWEEGQIIARWRSQDSA